MTPLAAARVLRPSGRLRLPAGPKTRFISLSWWHPFRCRLRSPSGCRLTPLPRLDLHQPQDRVADVLAGTLLGEELANGPALARSGARPWR